jgi:flagellar protein FliS
MNYGKMLGQYQRTSVESASKVELVVLCYEKAIQSLGQAQRYYVDREYEKKGMALQKALSIINELQSSLDFENGGQIARNLDRIYTYMAQKLLLADFNMDLPVFDEVIRMLDGLKEAWETVAANDRDAHIKSPPAAGAREGMSQLAAA